MSYNFKYLNRILLILFTFISEILFSQNINCKKIEQLLENGKSLSVIKTLEPYRTKTTEKNKLGQIYYYLGIAYSNENQNVKSYKSLKKSENYYRSIDSTAKVMEVKLEIANILNAENVYVDISRKYFLQYLNYAEKLKNPKLLSIAYYKWASFLIDKEPQKSKLFFFKALEENKKIKDEKNFGNINSNLAVLYNEKLNQPDSALYYYQKAFVVAKKNNNVDDICMILINQAGVYYNKEEYKKALELLKEADRLPITIYTKSIKSYIHETMAMTYNELGNYKKAFSELSISRELENKKSNDAQNSRITELEAKYRFKENEFDKLNLKIKNRNKTFLLYIIFSLLFASIVIGVLRIKNLNRKKKIAEQDKLIQVQKLENVLKEHELQEIDLLLEGQEKERLKLANELHDNLGSLMATLKLNFQNLKLLKESNKTDNDLLYDKTDALLDEAYQKIRGIAHTKNAGVIGNDGLVPAIQNIAKKISIPNKLNVEIIPFGLDERLDNALEVSIFRMIQEILTNAIKHAEATEITVQLTQHKNSLNIIIEDNGKGFNVKKVDKKEGMGLANIEKKTEHMGGTFTIDSFKGRGTTIIIDLPL